MSEEIIDIGEFSTKAAKLKFFKATKVIMGLSDWNISFHEDLDNGNMGECWADPETREAELYLKPGLGAEDFKRVVIHELEHCNTAKIRDVEWIRRLIQRRCGKAIADELTTKIEKELWSREEEVVISVEEIVFNILSATGARK